MSTIIRSALVAIALLASASAAMARPVVDEARHHQQQYDSSTDRAWAFWDAQQRNGS